MKVTSRQDRPPTQGAGIICSAVWQSQFDLALQNYSQQAAISPKICSTGFLFEPFFAVNLSTASLIKQLYNQLVLQTRQTTQLLETHVCFSLQGMVGCQKVKGFRKFGGNLSQHMYNSKVRCNFPLCHKKMSLIHMNQSLKKFFQDVFN